MTCTARPFLHRSALRLASWLGVLALVLQTAIPLGQAIPVSTGFDGLPRTLVICSAQGTRTIPLPHSGAADRQTAQTAACVVCLSHAAGAGLDLPATAALPFPPAGGSFVLPHGAAGRAPGIVPGLPQARAPPVFV